MLKLYELYKLYKTHNNLASSAALPTQLSIESSSGAADALLALDISSQTLKGMQIAIFIKINPHTVHVCVEIVS